MPNSFPKYYNNEFFSRSAWDLDPPYPRPHLLFVNINTVLALLVMVFCCVIGWHFTDYVNQGFPEKQNDGICMYVGVYMYIYTHIYLEIYYEDWLTWLWTPRSPIFCLLPREPGADQSTDPNGNLFWKCSHRHTQK